MLRVIFQNLILHAWQTRIVKHVLKTKLHSTNFHSHFPTSFLSLEKINVKAITMCGESDSASYDMHVQCHCAFPIKQTQ